MEPEDRARAGRAVAQRIAQLGMTVPEVARLAEVSGNTIRALINGTTWPTYTTRRKLNAALNWPEGEIGRRATDGDERLRQFTDLDLLRELCRRGELRGA